MEIHNIEKTKIGGGNMGSFPNQDDLFPEFFFGQHYSELPFGKTGYKKLFAEVIQNQGELRVDCHSAIGLQVHIKRKGLEKEFIGINFSITSLKHGVKLSVDIMDKTLIESILERLE